MSVVVKRQQFENSERDVIELRVSKCPCVNAHYNEKEKGLEEY